MKIVTFLRIFIRKLEAGIWTRNKENIFFELSQKNRIIILVLKIRSNMLSKRRGINYDNHAS